MPKYRKMAIGFGRDADGVNVDGIVLHYYPSFDVNRDFGSHKNVLLQQKEHDLPDLCASR